MTILDPVFHSVFVILHIIGVMIGVGSVTVTDYFHLLGLGSKKRERKLIFVYPFLSRLIIWAIYLTIISGAILVWNKPELLSSGLFRLKMGLFGVILINGYVLHKHVFPNVVKCVLNKKGKCPNHVLWISSISGTISIVTWYSVLVLALTKEFAYKISEFLFFYFLILIFVFFITYFIESNYRAWRKPK
jgi:hypothetical protein